MTSTIRTKAAGSPGVLAVLTDPQLRDELDRVAAAVGVRVVHAGGGTVSRKTWSAAAAVVVDEAAADQCGRRRCRGALTSAWSPSPHPRRRPGRQRLPSAPNMC